MKKFKQLLVPAVIILMGAGAAFATNAAKDSDSSLEDAYYFDNATSQCIKVENVQCTSIHGEVCTWTDNNKETHNLSRIISSTMCGSQLYKP